MPHAVPPNPSSRPALKHKQQPAMARSQTRQQSAYGYSATPARRNQALEAWTRVARTHADIIRAIGEGASSASESSVTDDISSQPSRQSSALSPQNTFAASSGWYPIDHRRHLDASPQHTNGATQYRWVPSPAPVMLTRDALSSLEATAGNDLYSPSRNSAVISFCSTNLSDIDQRGSNGTTQYADDERYTEVSPGSSLWASVDDQVSDIVFEEPSPPSEPAVEWTVSRTMFEESHVSSLQLELSPPDADLPRDNGLEDYAVDRARVMEEYIVAPVVEEYTELVIEAPSGPPVITPEYRKMADHLSEWVADWLWKVVNSANFAEALSKQSNTAGSRRKEQAVAPAYLSENIRSILLATLLQPSAVFLALWFIKRLPVFAGTLEPYCQSDKLEAAQRFRAVLFGEGDYPAGSSEKYALELYAPFKLFVNGVLLASKMLDDTTFSNKVWHEISQIAIRDINSLELASLELFEHDLTVPSEVWGAWLASLRRTHLTREPFPAPIGPARETPHGAVLHLFNTLIDATSSRPHAYDGPVFLGIEERIAQRLKAMCIVFDIDEMDEDGPIRDEYRSSRRPSGAGAIRPPPPDLPPPAEWFPAADPIVPRATNPAYKQWPTAGTYTSTTFSYGLPAPAPVQHEVSRGYYWSANVGYSFPATANTGYSAYANHSGFPVGYHCGATCCT